MSKATLSILNDESGPVTLACELVEESEFNSIDQNPKELELLPKQCATKRKTEFILGRAAGHRGLKALGASEGGVIGKAKGGEPLWPNGFVGSISHTTGAALAVVGLADQFASLGADLERIDRKVKREILEKIALPAERAWVTSDKTQQALRTLLLFSAKESGYKALFPLTKKYMGFKDLFVRWDDDHQSFIGTLLVDLNDQHRAGDLILIQSVIQEPYILTCAILPKEE